MMYRKAGEVAPEFAFPDSVTGADTRLSALATSGGTTLVVWIKLGCPTCQLIMPFVERIHGRVAGRPDRRVVVVTQDAVTDVPAFRRSFQCETVPILCEPPPYGSADQYGVTNTPTLFLVDSQQRVQWSEAGFNRQALEQLTARLTGSDDDLFTPAEAIALPAFRPG